MTTREESSALDPELQPEPEQGISEEELQALAQEAEQEAANGTRSLESEELARSLEQKTKEAAEANEKYLRTYADFENYRKRMQRDLADFRRYANEQIATDLLTVADHLGLAIQHAAESGEANQGLLTGVQLVYKQLRDVLEKYGIQPFKAAGEPFDPAKHDAMMQVESADVPANTVVQVFQEGYLYHDKVLRHAKVGVSKRPAGERGTERPSTEEATNADRGEEPDEA
jgi:molecular chaperone GrpE